ncbi:MAG: type II secretion system GspH family protein [Acidobacteriota bacterium]|nr:type II secretion system GspH family protein [Acidobacteriota bacterium]
MIYLLERIQTRTGRGGLVRAVRLPSRRVTFSRCASASPSGVRSNHGFTLIELVITITVLTILTLSVVPLLKLSVKRQKEQQLRAALRDMRTAIDEFRRDTNGMQCTGLTPSATGEGAPGRPAAAAAPYIDPRSKVVISDCTIFGVDNPDRYPPDLETLVSGVNVIPRGGIGGGRGDLGVDATQVGGQLSTKKKVYLRGIPIDPMTGEDSWDLCSCYDESRCDSWGGENVFDVRSKSKDTSLNGEKYSDW